MYNFYTYIFKYCYKKLFNIYSTHEEEGEKMGHRELVSFTQKSLQVPKQSIPTHDEKSWPCL